MKFTQWQWNVFHWDDNNAPNVPNEQNDLNLHNDNNDPNAPNEQNDLNVHNDNNDNNAPNANNVLNVPTIWLK